MRILIFFLFGLVLLYNLFILPFYHVADAKEKGVPPHSHAPLEAISDALWADSLVTFQERLKTNPKTARAELQSVAKKIFGEHTLTEEWVPLYFRIRSEGTEHPSDVKRLAELEIRMLTSLVMETGEFQKYAVQMQRLQEAYQKYDDMEKSLQNHGHSHNPNHTSKPKTGDSSSGEDSSAVTDESHAHNSETDLNSLLDRDPAAARTELLPLMAAEFNNHPRIEELIDTVLAFSAKKRVTYPELIALIELQIQILKHGDLEKHKDYIQEIEKSLKKLRNISKLLEKQGSLETDTIKFSIDIQGFLPKKKE